MLLLHAPNTGRASPRQVLYHVAWPVGEGMDALRRAEERLDGLAVAVDGAVDHSVSWSIDLRDPEGNQVGLFADNLPQKKSPTRDGAGRREWGIPLA